MAIEKIYLQSAEATSDHPSGTSSCAPFVTAYDIPGVKITLTSAVGGLLCGLALRGYENEDAISRMVFNLASALAKISGHEEDDMKYMEDVVDYMSKTHYLAGTRLHVHFLLRCAMLYVARGCLDHAFRACKTAQKVAAAQSEMEDLEITAWKILSNIYFELGQEQELHSARLSYLDLSERRLSLTTSAKSREMVEFVEELRDIGVVCYSVGRIEDGLDYLLESLRMEGEGSGVSDPHSATTQALALLRLSEFYFHWSNAKFAQQGALLLTEQAIAGFQHVECTCSTDYVDSSSSWGGTGTTACGRHHYLSEAWKLQGHIHQKHGRFVEAEKSYKQGLSLARDCKEGFLEADFHLLLGTLYFSMSHGNLGFGITRLERIPDQDVKLLEKMHHHMDEFLKAYKPGASLLHDQIALLHRRDGDIPREELNDSGESTQAIKIEKMLSMSGRRGHFDRHAVMYTAACAHLARVGHFEACKETFFLALKFLRSVPTSDEARFCRQLLGQFAMEEFISKLDIAEELWHEVILEAEEMLQNLASISDDHALQYFEVSKHANMAMAKCQMIRAKESQSSQMASTYAENALVWAERGKGRILLSHLGATRKTKQAKFENLEITDGGSAGMLNPRLSYSVDFESDFLSNDTFALDFIMNRGVPSSVFSPENTVFVEYTFIDYKFLLVHIIIDGSTSVNKTVRLCLSGLLDKQTQIEAEKELDAVYERRSVINADTESPSSTNMDGASIQHKDGWCEHPGDDKFLKPRHQIENSPDESHQSSTGDAATDRVLMAMDKYATNRVPFNPWIPGIVVGIQRRAIEAQQKRRRRQNSHNEDRNIRRLLQTLYDVLIKPIQKDLFDVCNPGDTIVFVPHEDLGVVPFAALHESGGKYLIEQYAIFVSPSIWSSRHCQNLYEEKVHSKCPEGAPVLVGRTLKTVEGITYYRTLSLRLPFQVHSKCPEGVPVLVGRSSGYPPGWPDLSEAHQEVNAVAEKFGSVHKILDNTADSRAHMKEKVMEVLPEASWIHLCLHGEISPQFPQGSLLLGDSDNHRLDGAEIMINAATSRPWLARAAIASACQTGLGAVAGGGIQGFASSFVLAGVPSCVLAMWEVNQRFCTEFMVKLYTHLRSGAHLARAMQETTLHMMKETKLPGKIKRPISTRKVINPPIEELKWSIFDWAVFSGFGYPGVALPKVAKGEGAHTHQD